MPKPTPEYLYSEKPLIDQLQTMGWQYIGQNGHITQGNCTTLLFDKKSNLNDLNRLYRETI